MKRNLLMGLILWCVLINNGCKISYSVSGANTGKAKTFSVKYFPNNAKLVAPTLSRTFTDALKDKFNSETKLNAVSNDGDLQFEGEITDYDTAPLAVQANDKASQNRLTITVSVTFTNRLESENDFAKTTFTRFYDYSSQKQLVDVEAEAIKKITEELVQDIFNKAVVNW